MARSSALHNIELLRGSWNISSSFPDSRLRGAPLVGSAGVASTSTPSLPMLRRSKVQDRHPMVCAAYRASCVGRSGPPRAKLDVATGHGGLGFGESVGDGRWRLRSKDFCKGAPRELSVQPIPSSKLPERMPTPAQCFCPTNSFEKRIDFDPEGFHRLLPAGSHPRVPRLPQTTRCSPGRSFITYQCASTLLTPPKRILRSDVRKIHVLLATSDHFGHGLFALVQRVLNQIHFARSMKFEPHVFLGEYTFMEPQVLRASHAPMQTITN